MLNLLLAILATIGALVLLALLAGAVVVLVGAVVASRRPDGVARTWHMLGGRVTFYAGPRETDTSSARLLELVAGYGAQAGGRASETGRTDPGETSETSAIPQQRDYRDREPTIGLGSTPEVSPSQSSPHRAIEQHRGTA